MAGSGSESNRVQSSGREMAVLRSLCVQRAASVFSRSARHARKRQAALYSILDRSSELDRTLPLGLPATTTASRSHNHSNCPSSVGPNDRIIYGSALRLVYITFVMAIEQEHRQGE